MTDRPAAASGHTRGAAHRRAMVQKCDNSLYVAGIKVRSGQVVATWTGKDGREHQARVFTGAKGAALHHERTGETVITIDELARLQGVAIRARIDGIDAELPLRPGARGRAGRQQFDHRALRAQLGKEGYRQALDVATRNLPVAPGASVKYSRKVIDAWLKTQSPVGLARTMAERPGTLVASTDSILAAAHGHIGVVAGVFSARCRAELADPNAALDKLADELWNFRVRDISVLGSPGFHDAMDQIARTAIAQLAARPDVATRALVRCGEAAVQVYQGVAVALVGAQAIVEAAYKDGSDKARADAAEVLHTVVGLVEHHAGPGTGVVLEQRILRLAESVSEGAVSTHSSPRWPDEMNPSLMFYINELKEIPRAVGTAPSVARVTNGFREEFDGKRRELQDRWDTICDSVAERHGVVAAASHTAPRSRGNGDVTTITTPMMVSGEIELDAGRWIGLRPDGTVVTYVAHDPGNALPRATDYTGTTMTYPSVDDAFAQLAAIARTRVSMGDTFTGQYVERVTGWDKKNAEVLAALIAELAPVDTSA